MVLNEFSLWSSYIWKGHHRRQIVLCGYLDPMKTTNVFNNSATRMAMHEVQETICT
jgi:hypothetical protein